jgi:murein DD-endopeptidase MepM/ murein hydrolase activator NlpD
VTASPTPVLCDPAAINFCISDGTFLLQRPIQPPGNDMVDRGYAYGSTEQGTRQPHHGVDLYNATGVPVLAAAAGTVFYAGNDLSLRFGPQLDFYGNLIVLAHSLPGRTLYTLYGHLSKLDVTTGMSVQAGEKIGEVGSTGIAIGSHLHFEVRLYPQDYNSTLDPELWLNPELGTGVLAIRLVNHAGVFQSTPLDIQYYPDPNGAFTQSWQPEIYPPEMDQGNNWENALLADLLPGSYRITILWQGAWLSRWVTLETGKLTQTEFILP